MIEKIKLMWKQFWCPHHWHEIIIDGRPCGFYAIQRYNKAWLCCYCGEEGDAYQALGGL